MPRKELTIKMAATKTIAEWLSKVESGADLSASEAEECPWTRTRSKAAWLTSKSLNRLISLPLHQQGEAVEGGSVGFARAMRRLLVLFGQAPIDPSERGPKPARADRAAGRHLRDRRRWRRHVQRFDGGHARRGRQRGGTRQPSVATGPSASRTRVGRQRIEALGRYHRYHAAIARPGVHRSDQVSDSCYAPNMHTAMKHAIEARREVGGRTVFNLLGPLTNPAGATAQVVGVPVPALVEKLGRALAELETPRAYVNRTGWMESTVCLAERREPKWHGRASPFGAVRYRVKPAGFRSYAGASPKLQPGGDAAGLNDMPSIRSRLSRVNAGPQRDFVCINAAARRLVTRRPSFLRTSGRR